MTNSNNNKQLNNEFMMPMLPQSYPSTIQNPNINNVGSINPNLNNLNQTQTHQLNDQLNRMLVFYIFHVISYKIYIKFVI